MALQLRLKKGEDVIIGTTIRMVLEKIVSTEEIVVAVTDEAGTVSRFHITDEMNQEISPNVRLSLGIMGDYVTAPCLFEAPRDIRIMRGDLLRREPDDVHNAKLCTNG